MDRDEALRLMATSLQRETFAQFHVGLVGYFIDGRPYSADGLAVNADTTPNLAVTDDGFVCDAFFPPAMLDPATVAAHGIIQPALGSQRVDLVRVRLQVRIEDIWAILEFINGEQREWFLDVDALKTRKLTFGIPRPGMPPRTIH